MAMSMATAWVSVRPSTKTFRSEMQRDMAATGRTTGRSFGNLFAKAASAAMMAAGIAMISKRMIDAAEESAKVNRQLAAVIKSTGGVAHVTSGHIDKLATSMMKASAIDDEAIKSGQAMLLTFTNIRNEVGKGNDIFDQSSRILLDMTAAMNGGNVTQENMRKQAIQLGKALNDPVRGLTSLRRVGVQFTDQQTEQIKKLAESGHVMEAQKLILRELTREFAGSAAATATPTKKLKVAFGELMEAGGKLLVPILQKITPVLVNLMDTLSALPMPAKIAGVAIIGLGIVMRAAAYANPWILLGAAIVTVCALIVKNWGAIKGFFVKVWHGILVAAQAVWGWIKKNWPYLLGALAGPFGLAAAAIIKHLGTVRKFAQIAWDYVKLGALKAVDWVLKAFSHIPIIGKYFASAEKTVRGWIGNIQADINRLTGKKISVTLTAAGGGKVTVSSSVKNAAGFLQFHTKGGLIKGGIPGKDSVLGMLKPGEVVVPTEMVNAGAVDHLRGRLPGFSLGGLVSGVGVTSPYPATLLAGLGAMNTAGAHKAQTFADTLSQRFANAISAAFKSGLAAAAGGAGSIVAFAKKYLGVPYVWGGTTPRGWDCSGFTSYVYRHFGYGIPRTSQQQQAWARASRNVAGSLVFFGRPAYHVGLSLGGAKMINAYGTGYGTIVSSLAGNSGFGIPPGGFRKMGRGGVIREPIFGIGRSGRGYMFGERGEETVTPGVGGPPILNFYLHPTSNPAEVGAAVVKAIKAHETRSGKGWRS